MTKKVLGIPFVLWMLLVILTSISFALFEGGISALIAGTAIIVISALKSRLIILHYMEAKRAASHWKFMYDTWNFTCAALIIVANAVTLLHHGR